MKRVWLILISVLFFGCEAKRDKETGVYMPEGKGNEEVYPVGAAGFGGAFVYCYLKTIDSVQYIVAYGPVNGGIAIIKHRDLHK